VVNLNDFGPPQLGVLVVTGNYTQSRNAGLTLAIDRGGAGLLEVGGAASLDGSLFVGAINGYYPDDGATFGLISAGSVGGRFSSLSFYPPSLTGQLDYGDAGVTLTVHY
jgi:hypothetical protein